jgi:hypothetical protein
MEHFDRILLKSKMKIDEHIHSQNLAYVRSGTKFGGGHMNRKWLKKSLLLAIGALAFGLLFVGLVYFFPNISEGPFAVLVGGLIFAFFTIGGLAVLIAHIIASIRVLALVHGTIQKILWIIFIWIFSLIGAVLFYFVGDKEEH